MNVSVTKQMEKMVRELVEAGRYGSASEVVRDGLRLVHEREARLQALREAIREGFASAEGDQWHVADKAFFEEIKREGRRRLAASRRRRKSA